MVHDNMKMESLNIDLKYIIYINLTLAKTFYKYIYPQNENQKHNKRPSRYKNIESIKK